MYIIDVCERFGWTYDQYMDQPDWFLTLLKEKYVRDNKAKEMEIKKLHRGK